MIFKSLKCIPFDNFSRKQPFGPEVFGTTVGSVGILLCSGSHIFLPKEMLAPCQITMIPTSNQIVFPKPSDEWNVLCWILFEGKDAQRPLLMLRAMHLDSVAAFAMTRG